MADSFHEQVKKLIKSIPKGKVATYGLIATMAGSPRAARQVVRVLHSCSDKDKLPWHRVINREGKIALKHGDGYELQKAMLEKEGVVFGLQERIDLEKYLWKKR